MSIAEFREQYNLLPSGRAVRKPANDTGQRAAVSIRDLFVRGPQMRNLRAEEALGVEFYNRLVAEFDAGRLRAVCTFIPNELPRPNRGGPGINGFAITVQNKRRAMGRIPGASDWVFTWATGGGWIELKEPGGEIVMRKVKRAAGKVLAPVKSDKGRESDEQRAWGGWCAELGVPRAVCYSVEQALDVLRSWGALLPARVATATNEERL